jgi:hypothetical protein
MTRLYSRREGDGRLRKSNLDVGAAYIHPYLQCTSSRATGFVWNASDTQHLQRHPFFLTVMGPGSIHPSREYYLHAY